MSDELTADERAALRQLLKFAPALTELAGAMAELERQPANAPPPLRPVEVAGDGALLVKIACRRRIAAIADRKTPPVCAWLPVAALEGAFKCRTCGRAEYGGDRAALLVALSGRAPSDGG
jgi:hypothetical protein